MPPPPPPPKRGESSAAAKERNEYIPSFISQKPFYVAEDTSAPAHSDYLEHQRLQSQKDAQKSNVWYDRGKKLGPAATKYRKGACENCGAMTHKTKECLSRPRKFGAKWTGKDIQADEKVQDFSLGWDAKRDRWNGYDATDYDKVVKQYHAVQDMKGQSKTDIDDPAEGDSTTEDVGGDRYEEETDMGRQQSTSTRNLRIREDTAKYLLNLDPESARYDPKTRSMIDSGATGGVSADLVAEEGFVKKSGDAAEFEAATRAAWESSNSGKGIALHMQAMPTSGEYARKKELEEKKVKKEATQKALAAKYGNQENFKRDVDKAPAVVESERFVEYDEKGKIKGAQATKIKSSYAEDVHINNHTSVWGSWWRDFKWGYACCHSTIKNSYCTGEEGMRALEAEENFNNAEVTMEEVPKEIAWREEEDCEKHVPNAVEDDAKATLDAKPKKRAFEELYDGLTEAQLDEYRRKKAMKDDPMAGRLNRDELVN